MGRCGARVPRAVVALGLGLLLGPLAALLAGSTRPGPGAPVPAAAVPDRPGPALRSALELTAGGDPAAAAVRLAEIAARWPSLGDHALRLEIAAWLAADRAETAITRARDFATRHPDSPLAARVAVLRSDAYASLGDGGQARAALEDALAASRDADERAELRLRLARARLDAGQPEAARTPLVELWTDAVHGEQADAADALLATLAAAGEVAAPSAAEWTRRGEALARAGEHARAVDAYDRALGLGLSRARRARLHRDRAVGLFHARRYPEAVEAFEALGTGSEARFWRARALARSGRIEDSIAAFESLGRERTSFGWRSRYLVATLLEDEPGGELRAAAHFESVARAAPDAELRRTARWRLAWLRFRSGDLGRAAGDFEALAAAEPHELDRLRARYWALRAGERADGADRSEGYADLARAFPLSYYGWRAAARAAEPLLARAGPAAGPVPEPTLADSLLLRPRALLEAGLADEAEAEVARLATRTRGLGDHLVLAELAGAAGSPSRERTLAAAGREIELARGPAPRHEALWWHAWPRPWADAVEPAARREAVEPELVWALMREESGFRPAVVSPAGARGLLQLMPTSAASAAASLDAASPHPNALFEPALNVRLGTHLLGGLYQRFPGRLSAAIGGYNAGPEAVSRWLRERPALEDDVWVESIPYDETRGYVRRVLRSLHAYRVLY